MEYQQSPTATCETPEGVVAPRRGPQEPLTPDQLERDYKKWLKEEPVSLLDKVGKGLRSLVLRGGPRKP